MKLIHYITSIEIDFTYCNNNQSVYSLRKIKFAQEFPVLLALATFSVINKS